MATKTFTVTKQMMASSNTGDANPGDLHIPIGRWTSLAWNGRATVYAPVSFAGMTAINAAYLFFRVHAPSSGWHAKGSLTTQIACWRKSVDWSETSHGGSAAIDELWGGDGSAVVNSGTAGSGDVTNFSVPADNAWISLDITSIVQAWFAGSPNYGILVTNYTSEANASYAREFWSRHASGSQPYIYIDYETNTAPNAPTSLSPTGDQVRHTGSSVTLSGTRSDPDSGDYLSGYQIQVYNDALSVAYYDQYAYPGGSPTSFSQVVSGLPTNVFLQWRVRTRDKAAAWGPFSSWQRFKLNSVPNAPTLSLLESPTSDIKTLTPTFRVTHSDPDSTDTKAYKYQIVLETSAGAAVWDTGEVTLGTPATTVSKLYNGPALSWGTSYRWKARTQDSNGSWSSYSGYTTFTTHATGVPVSLSPTAAAIVGGLTPTFTGSRATSADSLTSAQIQVYSSDGATLIWDSGVFTSGVTSTGFSKAYAGATLAYGTHYKWRAQVTSTIGGTSAWSSLQEFVTPEASDILTTSPVGSGITDLTPDFAFSRTNSFNAYQIVLYAEDGTTVVWDSGTVAHASATSKSVTYPGTPALDWATTYKWQVRVSSDSGSTWGGGYTDLVAFTTEEAGVPDLVAPGANAWLGAPWHMVPGETLTGITGNAYSTVTLDTTDFQQGASSLKAAIASHPAGTSDVMNLATGGLDLSDYGDQTPIKVSVKISSLTNVTALVCRIYDSLGAWVEYDVLPASAGAWEEISCVKGTPDGSSGTIDWSDITEAEFRLTSSATVTLNLWADDFRVDATSPSFDGDATGGETIDTVHIVVYASDQTTVVWDSGDVAVGATSFSVTYGGSALTPGATYYWTAQYTEDLGPTGGFASMQAFTLNSAPSAPTALDPSTGSVEADTLTPEFSATFSDTDLSKGDTPSLLEVEVYRNSDSTLMHTLRVTSGLVAGANVAQRTTEGTALSYETEYKWRARYADRFGVYGAWSSYNVFKPSQSPTVAITSPVSTISSPAFNVVWTFSSSGGKAQNRYRVTITRDSDSVLVYDSGLVFSSVASHSVPGGFLVNSTAYTITVVAYDTDGLVSAEDTAAITSAWAAPDAITGFSVSALEATSEMLLAWDQSNLASSDFSYYQIYRRRQGEEWEKYATVTNQSVTEYSDFFAGHGVTYEYKITVWKKVVGDVDVESGDPDIPYAILDPDAWFFVGADRDDSHIFELPVNDESHSEPIQQEVFEPLGSRRKSIVRGKVLGAEGTLQVQWMDSEREDAQVYLRYLTDTAGPHILKSPFGDVWQVEFAGPAKKYTGGGHLGVTLTWIEVL